MSDAQTLSRPTEITPPYRLSTSFFPSRSVWIVGLLSLLLGTAPTWAQLTISIAYQGPSAPTNGGSLDPGAALYVNPGPPTTSPSPFWSPEQLGVFNYGIYNSREVDALSWGGNTMLQRVGPFWANGYRLYFSTDEWAEGDPILAGTTLRSEGLASSVQEASADLQRTDLTPNLQIPPFGCNYNHVTQIDGDGLPSPWPTLPALGLEENNPPAMGPDDGDTVDGVDAFMQSSDMRLYFSLDATWVDPFEGPYGNSGSAQANSVAPGDILVSDGSWSFDPYAPHFTLGLGPQDDVDALILWENGNGVFEPSPNLFGWQSENYDMLLFSVRRGSPIIGNTDSALLMPIEEGDILTTPVLPGTTPAIFIPAECLGLDTVRGGTASAPPFAAHGDDLDAMFVR